MLSFYFTLVGIYLYYSNSKYFPSFLFRPVFPGSAWVGAGLIGVGAALLVRSDGWAGGLLLSLVAASLAAIILQFFAVLGRAYFYGLMAFVHIFLLIDLINHAG